MSIRYLTVALMASSVAFASLSYAETTVKGSKSNTSDRMGGGGGGKGAGQLNPQPEPPGRR
jgi:50S ribosomal subunit-associated GTPase HflX